jgi:hypothetical protein
MVLAAVAGAYAMQPFGARHSASATRHFHPPFRIAGSVRVAPLRPGLTRRLNLRLRNPHRFPIWITALSQTVTVDRAHRSAGCSAGRDFRIRRVPRRVFPFKLGPRRTRTLRALGVRLLPAIRMRNLRTVNQDACQGARLRLRYTGNSLRTRPSVRARTARGRSAP